MFHDQDTGSTHSAGQSQLDGEAGGVSARMQDASAGMGRFEPARELAIMLIEGHAEAERSRMRAGPSEQSTSTATGSQRPAPARKVSAMCSATLSSENMAAAMPPWAKRVLLSSRRALVTSVTACLRLSSTAAMSPAMPLPTTMMCFMRTLMPCLG